MLTIYITRNIVRTTELKHAIADTRRRFTNRVSVRVISDLKTDLYMVAGKTSIMRVPKDPPRTLTTSAIPGTKSETVAPVIRTTIPIPIRK